ncbi:unnamed protein product [Caenorhabditis sp. 36 PRJEB53466]|nr:unnamed protein product [Caenorhabditis sp. 36 PRJEB53466]
MISAIQQSDFDVEEEIGEFACNDTSFCSYQIKDDKTVYAFCSGPAILIGDGMGCSKSIMTRFEMEFDVKKIFHHTFILAKHSEKEKETKRKGKGERKEHSPKPREFLVVCGEHRIVFLSLPDYHFYHYEIPFKLRNVFSCSNAILVERFYDSSTEQNFHNHDTFHLYSLSGPFGELLPVIYKTNGFHPQWKFCWQSHQDEAGMVDTANNFVVVYDQKEKVHRIYMARETEEQEVHSAIRYVETLRKQHDSTMFASSLAPQSAPRTTFEPTTKSPAMIALSEVKIRTLKDDPR